MKRVIHKIRVQLQAQLSYITGPNPRALCVQLHDDVPTLWFECDDVHNTINVPNLMVNISGTGHEVSPGRYVGSVQLRGSVWHFYVDEES